MTGFACPIKCGILWVGIAGLRPMQRRQDDARCNADENARGAWHADLDISCIYALLPHLFNTNLLTHGDAVCCFCKSHSMHSKELRSIAKRQTAMAAPAFSDLPLCFMRFCETNILAKRVHGSSRESHSATFNINVNVEH